MEWGTYCLLWKAASFKEFLRERGEFLQDLSQEGKGALDHLHKEGGMVTRSIKSLESLQDGELQNPSHDKFIVYLWAFKVDLKDLVPWVEQYANGCSQANKGKANKQRDNKVASKRKGDTTKVTLLYYLLERLCKQGHLEASKSLYVLDSPRTHDNLQLVERLLLALFKLDTLLNMVPGGNLFKVFVPSTVKDMATALVSRSSSSATTATSSTSSSTAPSTSSTTPSVALQVLYLTIAPEDSPKYNQAIISRLVKTLQEGSPSPIHIKAVREDHKGLVSDSSKKGTTIILTMLPAWSHHGQAHPCLYPGP
ncbi:uncharacterized protein PFL1_05679 [Pseudozyma flocculosa PF-1]|uniref:Uncharacterized protein n=1 Tax=Pseudozyma flocculosa PF-1 TaxID=1277687 RepID=A0A061H446_9BASI|nr:uncharacterized protein PFL1_05679 [Pseudozyma flocculosa PF-1]EPQ26700.1 hypothetical protein PFL1_05679 [Pseudozyma flocculosa PF-1]